MQHCSLIFKHKTWTLEDIKGFVNRRFEIGTCPICLKEVAILYETSSETEFEYSKKYVRNPKKPKLFDNLKKRSEKQRITVSIPRSNDGLNGFIYGKNKECHNKYGEVTSITQRSSDWQNNTALVKRIKVNKS